MRSTSLLLLITLCLPTIDNSSVRADDLIPPLAQMKTDRPRLLLRSKPTSLAISLPQLQALERDADFNAMLAQLKKQDHAASQAMVWLLTQDAAAAEKAIKRMRAYRYPGKVDTFHIYGHLTEFGLAYDWLFNCPLFTAAIKAEVRANVAPLAAEGIRNTNDHMFHNYIWMSAGGVAMWTLATAGEDDASSAAFEKIRHRFNDGLFPALRYLDGLPSEPMGYWSFYVFTPGVYTLLAAQSAFEADLVGTVRTKQNAWLDRNFDTLIQSTLPDMRFIPWGDLQSGPNGGVTMEMAGSIDAAAWGLHSPQGRQFSQWIKAKRGLARFYGDTAIFYMLYSRQLATLSAATGRSNGVPPVSSPADSGGARTAPETASEGTGGTASAWPATAFLAGNTQSGHFVARSAWDDNATVVAFTCTDHFGDHHHYDQGSFIIYRRGLLAVDPPVYKQVRGPQQKTEYHNTLLIGGQPQRQARGQYFVTVEDFQKNLKAGRKLETGDICSWHNDAAWAAVSGQFAQAYDCPDLQSCVRQLLFVRPSTVIIVDRLVATPGKQLPDVQWLLQLPAKPQTDNTGIIAANKQSWIRCRPIQPGNTTPSIEPTPVNTHCVSLAYTGKPSLTLVHALEVGDGDTATPAVPVVVSDKGREVEITVAGKTFVFTAEPTFAITEKQ